MLITHLSHLLWESKRLSEHFTWIKPTKPPSVHFGQHNEGQFVVQLLNPWLQTIESPMDSPGISIKNPSTITYLLLVSFFLGGPSSRWILLFKKDSCFSDPSISWNQFSSCWFQTFQQHARLLGSFLYSFVNSSCSFETFHPRMRGLCFTATDFVCTKGVYY